MISEFTILRCDCGSDLFMPLLRMKYKTDGGTITEPAGHKCSACGATVDNAYMIRLIDMDRKRKEAQRLTAEVAEAEKAMPKKETAAVTR